jgi:CubicO group peptidase (beta-lactamase class C family)
MVPRRHRWYWLTCVTLLAGCPSDAPAPDAGTPNAGEPIVTDAMRADIEAYTAAAVARYAIPGAALAVVVGGRTVYQQGFGVRGLDDARPVTPDTLFMIGSITKSMTGLMTATLVDDGRLGWDTRVVDVMPGFALSDPASTPAIRVRDLLSHASGVAGHDAALIMQRFSPLELVRSLAGIPVLSAPGAAFHYSNQAFTVGGFTAALAAGAPNTDLGLAASYTALMNERVFGPIGMRSTTLDFDAASGSPNHALPHAFDPTVARIAPLPLPLERFALSVAPAGAVWSNAADLTRYAIAEMAGVAPDGTRVVSAENLRQTQTAQVAIQEGYGYGFGWGVVDPAVYHGRRAVMHTGGTQGFITHIALLPDDQIGVVVLSNHALGDGFCNAVREYVVETLLGLDHAGDAAALAALHATEQSLVDLVSSTSRPAPDQVAGLLGSYGDRAVASFSAANGFALETDFGALPLAGTGEPGSFVTTGVTVGVAASFTAGANAGEQLTISGLSLDPSEFPLTLQRRP